MRTSSMSGFDLREAVDGLREAFAPRIAAGANHPDHDIRSAILVELLTEPMHGYQLIQAIETRSGGVFKPTAGSVYPTLQLLADEALVEATQVGERKVYSLTPAGRLAAAEVDDVHTDKPQDKQRRQGAQAAIDLTKSGVKLAHAVSRVAQDGTPAQSERAVAILEEARRKVYAILAED